MCATFRATACAGVKWHLVGRGKEAPRLIPQQVLGAVAVMDIEINDRDALQTVVIQRMYGRDGDGSEQAKAHRRFGFGMVTGWAARDKGGLGISRQHCIHGGTGRANRARGGFKRTGRKRRIAVKLHPAVCGHRCAYPRHIARRMTAQQHVVGRKRCGTTIKRHGGQSRLNGRQSRHLFRVAGRGDMARKRIMGIKQDQSDNL